MRRRDFITGIAGSVAAWPLAARAQQAAMPVIGYLSTGSRGYDAARLTGFRRGLAEAGYVEGRNTAIEYRWAEGRYDRLPELASDLVHRQVIVISAAGGIPGARAAKAATSTIPIVFLTGADPVAAKLVTSLSRPGGNLTGVTTLGNEVGSKRLELLHELVPQITAAALLVNPTSTNTEVVLNDLQAAARTLKVRLHVLNASKEDDFEAAFTSMAQLGVGALLIANDPFLIARAEALAALALRHAMPTIFYTREFAEAGGLMSYGGSLTDAYRLMGSYTGRILRGDKPADLPVQQATKVELIINLRTAKALGLTVPPTLLARADEVIE